MSSKKEQLAQLLVEKNDLDHAKAAEAARIILLVPAAAAELLARLDDEPVDSSPCTIRGYTADELMSTYNLDETQAYKVLAWLQVETASAEGWLADRLRDLKSGQRHMHEYA